MSVQRYFNLPYNGQMKEAEMRLFCSFEPQFMCDRVIDCDI